jgi:putative flippase GtrA
MSINQKILQEFLKFIVVGLINTACNYGLFILLLAVFKINYLISGSLGFSLGAVIGFTLNRKWTFKSDICYKKGIIKYLSIQLFCLGLNLLAQIVATNIFNVPESLSQLAGIVITTFINFVLMKYLIFRK